MDSRKIQPDGVECHADPTGDPYRWEPVGVDRRLDLQPLTADGELRPVQDCEEPEAPLADTRPAES